MDEVERVEKMIADAEASRIIRNTEYSERQEEYANALDALEASESRRDAGEASESRVAQRAGHVCIVGLGPSSMDHVQRSNAHEPDPVLQADEFWAVNAAGNWLGNRVAWDRLFVMDYLEGEAAKYPGYVESLVRWSELHPRSQLITSVVPDGMRLLERQQRFIEYPLREVLSAVADVVGPGVPPYFHNSIPYMLAYAWFLGFEQVSLWGCDYHHPSLGAFRENDRANCEYWIGFLRAQGVKVAVPDTTTLLNTCQPPRLYGYPPGVERGQIQGFDKPGAPGQAY